MLIVRRSKLYYTASGIITPIGGRPVHPPTARLETIQELPEKEKLLYVCIYIIIHNYYAIIVCFAQL